MTRKQASRATKRWCVFSATKPKSGIMFLLMAKKLFALRNTLSM